MYTKKDLVSKVAENLEISKVKAKDIVDGVFTSIDDLLKDDAEDGLNLNGFLKLQVVTKPARTCINPKTMEKVEVPEKDVLVAKLSKKYKTLEF